MAKRKWRYDVRIAIKGRYTGDISSFLEMLLYDGAQVVSWSGGSEWWNVRLESEREPTLGRWLSFGLTPQDIRQEG